MSYTDNTAKFVAVLNKRIELPRLLNALGHMAAGLASTAPDLTMLKFLEYQDADEGIHPAISHYPFIVLEANNGNQIRLLRQKAIERKILYNDFVAQMIGSSSEEQRNQTRATKDDALEYYGICLFGATDMLDPVVKKFSLFH